MEGQAGKAGPAEDEDSSAAQAEDAKFEDRQGSSSTQGVAAR